MRSTACRRGERTGSRERNWLPRQRRLLGGLERTIFSNDRSGGAIDPNALSACQCTRCRTISGPTPRNAPGASWVVMVSVVRVQANETAPVEGGDDSPIGLLVVRPLAVIVFHAGERARRAAELDLASFGRPVRAALYGLDDVHRHVVVELHTNTFWPVALAGSLRPRARLAGGSNLPMRRL